MLTEMPRTVTRNGGAPARQERRASTGVVLDRLPAPVRRSRYPWGEWGDGSPRLIWAPRHFEATPQGMRSTIVTHARAKDMAVACVMYPEHPDAPAEWSLAFQFFPDRPFADGPPSDLFEA